MARADTRTRRAAASAKDRKRGPHLKAQPTSRGARASGRGNEVRAMVLSGPRPSQVMRPRSRKWPVRCPGETLPARRSRVPMERSETMDRHGNREHRWSIRHRRKPDLVARYCRYCAGRGRRSRASSSAWPGLALARTADRSIMLSTSGLKPVLRSSIMAAARYVGTTMNWCDPLSIDAGTGLAFRSGHSTSGEAR